MLINPSPGHGSHDKAADFCFQVYCGLTVYMLSFDLLMLLQYTNSMAFEEKGNASECSRYRRQ